MRKFSHAGAPDHSHCVTRTAPHGPLINLIEGVGWLVVAISRAARILTLATLSTEECGECCASRICASDRGSS